MRFAITFLLLVAIPAWAKPYPKGIMLLMSRQLDPSKPVGTHPALTHSNIDGMRVKIKWSNVEVTQGVYNWTPIDQAISLARSVGKKISISINAGANDCPQWLYSAGAVPHTIVNGRLAGGIMPVIDDPVFISKWSRFIMAFGARYDHNATVNYVVMTGIGNVVEWYESDGDYFKSLSPPNPPGTAKWIHQAETIIDAYAGGFPTTPFFGAIAHPYDGNDGLNAEKAVIGYSNSRYPGRFGLMTNTLSSRSSLSFYPCWAINTYRFTQPTGFQMLWSQIQAGDDGCKLGLTCPDLSALDESLTKGVQLGGRFVEVYEIDCNNIALQATITSHQIQLKALP
jgi:hypothetical protein